MSAVSGMDEDLPSPPKRQRLEVTEGMEIGGLPEEIWMKIFHMLDTKTRVKNASLTCRHWRKVMPYADEKSILQLGQLPYANLFYESSRRISSDGITAALSSLLPRIGADLKGIAYAKKLLTTTLVNSHLDLIVQYCPQLTHLDFGLCGGGWSTLSPWGMEPDRFVQQLRQLKDVKYFAMPDFNCATPFLHDWVGLLSNWPLEHLKLANFHDTLPSFVCPQLTDLKLFRCNVTKVQLAEICRNSPNLTTLAIKVPSDPDLSPITTLAHLVDLRLEQNFRNSDVTPVTTPAEALKVLQLMKQLKSLYVGLDDKAIRDLDDKWKLESLETFSWLGRHNVSGAGLIRLSGKLPGLKELVIAEGQNVTAATISALMANCPLLTKLDLSGTKMNGRCLALMGNGSNQLRDLHLPSCLKFDTFWYFCYMRKKCGINTPLCLTLSRFDRIVQSEFFRELSDELLQMNVILRQTD